MARRKTHAVAVASSPPVGRCVPVDDLPPLPLADADVVRVGVQRAARDAVHAHPSVRAARLAVVQAPDVAAARTEGRFLGSRRFFEAEMHLWQRTEDAWRAAHPHADGWPVRAALAPLIDDAAPF